MTYKLSVMHFGVKKAWIRIKRLIVLGEIDLERVKGIEPSCLFIHLFQAHFQRF